MIVVLVHVVQDGALLYGPAKGQRVSIFNARAMPILSADEPPEEDDKLMLLRMVAVCENQLGKPSNI